MTEPGDSRTTENGNSPHFKPRSQSARVASPDENPRSVVRPDLVAAWEREFYILRKVVEILDSLVDAVHLQALNGQIIVGVR